MGKRTLFDKKAISLNCVIWFFLIIVIGVQFCTPCFAYDDKQTATNGSVKGSVIGLDYTDIDETLVILYDETNAFQSQVFSDLLFEFCDIPAGEYYIKVESEGYHLSAPVACSVASGSIIEETVTVIKENSDNFFYSWTADETFFGYEESALIPRKKEILFNSEKLYIADTGAEKKLYDAFGVILANDEMQWSKEYASRMLDLFSKIYTTKRDLPSKWILAADHIANDIAISYSDSGDEVRISLDAFQNAIPRTATLNGISGTYYSNRLYDALIRFATHNGFDTEFIDNLLVRDYGCSIFVPDYSELTRLTTGETAEAFEQFHPEELISILTMFAEMPEGFHKIDGLKYLVRRADGYPHPLYPAAAAVSWPTLTDGYIEFMDSAFLASQFEDTYRLVIHEKAHFLWQHTFSDSLKAAWCETGGWYENSADPDGWSTTKETEFVSAYAHAHNPNEDMAESIAYYILLPDRLESRSPEKYEFIRNYIMNGEIYLSQIREDLTFEVYNLFPDYNYPGRIVGVDIQVDGKPEEDKSVEITLSIDTHGDASFGASSAFMRISSEVDTFYDLYLHPTNTDCSTLTGSFTIAKEAASGSWTTDQICLTDQNENQRFIGSGAEKFGWKLYVTNSLSDYEKPQYVEGSLSVNLEPGNLEGHKMTYAVVSFKAFDNVGIQSVYCEIANQTYNGYRIDTYGTYDALTQTATIRIPFTEYKQSGTYAITYIALTDMAENRQGYIFFPESGSTPYTTFEYQSDSSDYQPPELDVNKIHVSAYPTHPEAPNGETVVNITYRVRDDKSGLGHVTYRLKDPIGNTHYQYHYHENYYTTYFDGDPTAWKVYTINVVLPEGSVPGTWGLYELDLVDKAGNSKTYDFVETVHFAVGDASGLYEINAIAGSDSVDISTNMFYDGDAQIYGYAAVYDNNGRMIGLSSYAEFSNGLQSFFFPDIRISCEVNEIAYAKVFVVDRQTFTPLYYEERPCCFE